ncbi:MAG: hypothetical protein ACYC97_12840, partial [Metallibacterium sp.]
SAVPGRNIFGLPGVTSPADDEAREAMTGFIRHGSGVSPYKPLVPRISAEWRRHATGLLSSPV